MKGFLLFAAVTAVAVAKPEMYREKEDFKYARSSSDEGTKAGFYGAQRGNMGGNYERAHNMDTLAQHQMSGLVRQVDGELGDGAKTRTGSVFSAANSRGIYGSGNYDLSNLEGRNFQEGVSYGDSQSQASSFSHQSAYNARSSSDSRADYTSNKSHNTRYQNGYNTYRPGTYPGQDLQNSNLYTTDDLKTVQNNEYGGRDSLGYYSNNGYHRSNEESSSKLHNSGGYGSDSQIRIISAMPVRVVVRPRPGNVNPMASQTYDSTHRDSSLDQNALGTETETLNNRNLQTNNDGKPINDAKHYESSYSYRKEWEKHDTVPVIVPTLSPYPKNSELYEDNQASTSDHAYDISRGNTNDMQSTNGYSRYQNHAKSASSSQSHQQFDYNAQHESSSSGPNMDIYGFQAHRGGTAANLNQNDQNGALNLKPKSYQASYSYHKSWERQGDPYVIKPATNDISETSQRLTSNSQYGSHYYDSQHHGSQTKSNQHYFNGNAADCDDNGHIRVARSYDTAQRNEFVYDQEAQNLEELGQQSQTQWEDMNSQIQQQWGQQNNDQQSQSKLDNLETLDQQTQNKWDLGDLGQQTQDAWNQENTEQQVQKQSDKLEDLGQQTQNQWDLQSTGHQTQGAWENFEQSQLNRPVDLGQQTQDTWTTLENEPRISNDKMNSEISTHNFEDQQQIYRAIHSHNWNSNTDSLTQEHSHDTNYNSEASRPSSLADLWGKIDKIEKQSSTDENKVNKVVSNNGIENTLLNQRVPVKNVSKIDNSKDNTYNTTVEYKPVTSDVPNSNKVTDVFTTMRTLHPSDVGRGDIGPEDSSSSENGSISEISIQNIVNNKKPNIDTIGPIILSTNNSKANVENQEQNSQQLFYVQNKKESENDSILLHSDYKKWFENENQNIYAVPETKSTSTTIKSPTTTILLSQNIPTPSIILEQESKKDHTQEVNIYDNNFNTLEQNTTEKEKLSSQSETTNRPQKPTTNDFNRQYENEFQQHSDNLNRKNTSRQESIKPQIVNNGQFAEQSEYFDQQDIPDSFDQQNMDNLEQLSQQNGGFDQQNVSPQGTFDQQNIGNLEQFGQQTDTFDQQNINPQESFDQQSMGNLEQFAQQNVDINQQNITPQETFDQQSMSNLEQFGQQSDTFDQQNVSPQESFDQQSMGNLEQFSQQSDSFDHQNLNPQETFDQQNIDNIEQFSQQSDSFDQQNLSQRESFDQQSIGNLEQFGQQSDTFNQQNVSPQESFDQQSMGNLEQFPQQSNSFYQQNQNTQETFDQQNIGNLEQFGQQSHSFDQQNISPQELFHQSMGNLEHFAQQSDSLNKQNFSPQESLSQHGAGQLEQFVQQNDELVIPIANTDDSKIQFNQGILEKESDHLVIPIQVGSANSQHIPDTQQNEEQVQSIWESKENIQQENVNNLENGSFQPETHNLQSHNNIQEKQGRENIEMIELIKKNETLDTPPEPVTENPGFWKSVGNKFVSAKDKIASWISRS